jgi:prophage antirepressor-like protein
MIKLFEFQKNPVRTEEINGKLWFSGADVFSVLELTWKGASGLKQRNIPDEWIISKESQTLGGLQKMTFVSEQALYMITFSAQKSEVAIKFAKWIAELLVKLRTGELLIKQNFDFKSHLDVKIQKDNSKKINAINFNNGGVTKTIEYNIKNCQLHTNQKPNQIIQMGKDLGLKSKQTTSAKEVIRNLKPELACSMSFTDKLVSEDNINHEIAAKTSLDYAQILFKQLMEIGVSRERLE